MKKLLEKLERALFPGTQIEWDLIQVKRGLKLMEKYIKEHKEA